MKTLSVIVPCYNEEENVPLFYEELLKNEAFFAENDLTIELIFVDDGSTDATLTAIKQLRERDERVRLISFSRNFGKEAALYAGLVKAQGDYMVFMDVDLQDPPALLPEMFACLAEGYDAVATRRVSRKGEPAIRSFFARRFYRLMRKIAHTEIVDGARDYRLITRQVAEAILAMPEYNRFTKGIFGWVGFRTKWLEYENIERRRGETKWSFWGLLAYSLEGITAFSTLPLRLSSVMGLFFCLVAFFFLVVIVVRALLFGDPTSGWPSLASIILLVSGIQLFCIGIMGEYMAKTYMEVKNRPLYIIKEETD
ncbi:MAG: glycosyltransferase family 2 protein [Lachnospiraceae bacterium]|jgi:glycosyltransferase involved in cell wall biosynthesis|nr:glycosyltransferase family 2 protein [Lachnospiraceae bacterium]